MHQSTPGIRPIQSMYHLWGQTVRETSFSELYRQTDSFTHSLTNKYTDTLFYILVQIYNRCLLLLPSIEFVGFTCVSRAPAVNIYVIHFQLVLGFDMRTGLQMVFKSFIHGLPLLLICFTYFCHSSEWQ